MNLDKNNENTKTYLNTDPEKIVCDSKKIYINEFLNQYYHSIKVKVSIIGNIKNIEEKIENTINQGPLKGKVSVENKNLIFEEQCFEEKTVLQMETEAKNEVIFKIQTYFKEFSSTSSD